MWTKARARIGVFLIVPLSACGQDDGFSPGADAGSTVDSGGGGSSEHDVAGSVSMDGSAATGSSTTFASSACKKDKVARSAMAHLYGLMVIDNQAGLDGLSCVAWQRAGADEMKIDLYNYMSACGTTWSGDAAVAADGTLDLHIDNPGCQVAQCGKCLYDWSFDVKAAIPANQVTPVAIAIDTCKGQQQTVQLAETLGAADAGVSCAFADYGALNEYASVVGTCGKSGMPCVGSLLCGSGSFTSTGTCDSGLVCDSSAAVNEPRCLVPCTTTADCPRADAWSCQSGLCRPAG
jgi:hypothetical protein